MNSRTIWVSLGMAACVLMGNLSAGWFPLEVLAVPTPRPSAAAEIPERWMRYVFRFVGALSEILDRDMSFTETRAVELGECRSTEKINGPLACVKTCQGKTVCLLFLQGPAGIQPSDLLYKIEEKPAEGSSSRSG